VAVNSHAPDAARDAPEGIAVQRKFDGPAGDRPVRSAPLAKNAAPQRQGSSRTPFRSPPWPQEREVIFMAPMMRRYRSAEQMQNKNFSTVTV